MARSRVLATVTWLGTGPPSFAVLHEPLLLTDETVSWAIITLLCAEDCDKGRLCSGVISKYQRARGAEASRALQAVAGGF